MRWTTRRRSSEGIFEPNMTPLIDVSLVLVVILMITTPLAFQSSIGVNSTLAGGRAAAQTLRTERVELAVLADGTVRVNRDVVPRAALAEALQPLLHASATRIVVVRCDEQVPHGTFVSVIDEAKALGAAQIAVVGR